MNPSIMDLPLEKKLDALRQISERKLLKILDSISGLKDLLIDPALMKPLERFIGVTALRKHGVEKIFRFEPGSVSMVNSQRVFLVYSEPQTVNQVLQQVQEELQKFPQGRPQRHHLILATGNMGQCAVSRLVEEEGLWGEVTLHALGWEFLKLDEGIWSLEYRNALKSLIIQNDFTMIKPIAKAIWSLQIVLGKPVLTWAQGTLAAKALNLVDTFKWPKENTRRSTDGGLGCFVVVSRDVDWPSALLTPVTYTALLSKVMDVRCGHVPLPTSSEASSSSSSASSMELSLKTDPIYQHIHNLHFSSVFPYLREQTKALQAEATSSKGLSAAEMKQYVKEKLSKTAATKKLLAQHIAACEAVVEQSLHTAEGLALRGKRGGLPLAEDLLGQGLLSLEQSLRLLALMSLGGVHDEASALKSQLLVCHGHKHLVTLDAMEKCGLFGETESASSSGTSLVGRVASLTVSRKSSSLQIARRFKLCSSDDAPAPNPRLPAQDMSYVFGGEYIPVVCRVVEWLIKGEPISQIEEALKLLPGPTIWQGRDGDQVPQPPSLPVNPKTFFIFFIGGVTYSEIAAFQILEALTGAKIIVAGTSILAKDSLATACS
ncbi:hypothetical protein B566_EDAN005897 [Ephemera danica]|nr:hypothetical protein B566_EDAN005897 [Ephemera danica]